MHAAGVSFSFAHLLQRLDKSSYVDANKEAVVFEGERVSYGALRDRAARLASALRADGLARGDRVAVLMRNDPAWFDVFFAVSALGGVLVPVNVLLRPAEVAFVLQDSGAATLVCGADLRPTAEQALMAAPACQRLLVHGAASGRFRSYAAFRDAAPAVFPDGEVAMSDPALLQYTSGTTGFPKGATHTVSSLLWNSFHQCVDFELRPSERYLCLPSLCWVAGLHDFTLATLWVGGTVILYPSGGLHMGSLLATLASERCNRVLLVATVLKQFVESEDLGAHDLRHLRYILSGAEPVPVPVIERCNRILPEVTLAQGYGLSEGPTLATVLRPEDAVRKIGSCGKPTTNTEARIVDDEGRDLPPGAPGELILRSPATMAGYWNQPEASAEALRGGWLRTGDLATRDDEGYFTICGRKKDMFISGGLNVYPAEVEAVLMGEPGVAECAVVGVPDDRWGEAGRAVLVPKRGATVDLDALRRRLHDRLASYKVPKQIDVWNDPLPRTASGKVRKFMVRDRLMGRA
jgi:fatty-acyl-CoA synthase